MGRIVNYKVMMVDQAPHWSLIVCENHMAEFNDAGTSYYVVEHGGEPVMSDDDCGLCAEIEPTVNLENGTFTIHAEHDPKQTRVVVLCPFHYEQALDSKMVDKFHHKTDLDCHFCI